MNPDPLVANAVALIHIVEKGMTDEQRIELWEKIREGYCKHCGRKLESESDYCHCWNDE